MNGNVTPQGLKNEVHNLASTTSENLTKLLESIKVIRKRKSSKIHFSDPIIAQEGKAIFYPHTINIIQGQAGVHKSRLAEIIAAALIKQQRCDAELLGFEKASKGEFAVLYVDTERNLKDQFPAALQRLQESAGYSKYEETERLMYVSLLDIPRKDRFSALQEYLEKLKSEVSIPLFIILDVSTDCVEDFNKTDKSMELIDLMNIAINEYDITFLCLIHENPKSEKARGHFGTELMNKASTAIQVGYEKDSKNRDTDLIRIRFLKCRSTARYEPFYAYYSESLHTLVLADSQRVEEVVDRRRQKATTESIQEQLQAHLGDGSQKTRKDLLSILSEEFDASERTIEERLKVIIHLNTTIHNDNGQDCLLHKSKEGKTTVYSLPPIQ